MMKFVWYELALCVGKIVEGGCETYMNLIRSVVSFCLEG